MTFSATFLLFQISSIFAGSLRLHSKTYPPILVCWFLFHFPQITNAKTHFFSWRRPFQSKLLFFQTTESAKRAFATRAGSGKPALLHTLFLENEKQNSKKNYRAMFSRYVQGHMQKFSSFRGKKNGLKSHLPCLYRHPFICLQLNRQIRMWK